jgi:hypothetical protein
MLYAFLDFDNKKSNKKFLRDKRFYINRLKSIK